MRSQRARFEKARRPQPLVDSHKRGLTISFSSDARTAAFLLHTPVGQLFLVTGMGLDALAGVWMARLARVEP